MAPITPSDDDIIDLTLEDEDDDDFDAALSQRLPWLETPLKAGSNTIRILKLHRGSPDEQISSSLAVACLEDCSEYETLSYVWGDPSQTRTILVGGTAFEATTNLVDFLRHLRLTDADRMIWVDAICIDQSSEEEKQHQLKLMTSIYREGREAHIWFGAFTESWIDEIVVDEDVPDDDDSQHTFVPSHKITAKTWERVERTGREDLKFYQMAGGVAPFVENYVPGIIHEDVFLEALEVLDSAAAGTKMHEFPLYLRQGSQHLVNRHWATIMDCIRWLVTRPWWSRVWTMQEGLLPKKDPTFHTSIHSIAFSRLLNGIKALLKEQKEYKRHIKHTYLFWGAYQHFPDSYYSEARRICEVREKLPRITNNIWNGVSWQLILTRVQNREASDCRDHFFGIMGLLPLQHQRAWWERAERGFSRTAAQIFAQCTKMALAERHDTSNTLDILSDSRACYPTAILGLPSWAVDLTSRRAAKWAGNSRWHLYNACGGSSFIIDSCTDALISPELCLQGIKVGSVHVCESRDSQYVDDMIHAWIHLYGEYSRRPEYDLFWRTALMDRNIDRMWLHERTGPLGPHSLRKIKAWWRHVEETKGYNIDDVEIDRLHGDGRRGTFHYREVQMNTQANAFFMTERREPGLGTHTLVPGDEIYVLQGSSSPVLLRRVPGGRGSSAGAAFKFVGFCYVANYMYGQALNMGLKWSELVLI